MNKLLVVLALLLVALFLMFKFLPWWASLTIIVVGVFSLKWIGGYLIRQVFFVPFRMKGKALAGAQVTVHGIRPADAPDISEDEYEGEEEEEGEGEGEEDEASDAAYRWHYLDVTITPQPVTGGFTHWEPGELVLVGMDASPKDIDEEEAVSRIADCKVFQDGKFCEDEGYKYPGPQRLELHVGVKPGVRALQFRYYFELFGNVTLEDSDD